MKQNAWWLLLAAGIFETAWAVGLKYSEGLTNLKWTVFTALCLAASMWLLSAAVRSLPLGTAYAVWTGIGATGTALLGMALFREPTAWPRLLCLTLIIAGIAGLKWLE